MIKTKNNPIVSIIIPTYNRENYLAEAIQSVLCQTYPDFEIIVVDDCSTDNTAEVVKCFNDERLKYIQLEKNSGSSHIPRTTGFKAARGKYVALLDSDDYWTDPYKLQKQVDFLEANPDYSMVFHNAQIVNTIDLKDRKFLPLMDKTVFNTEDTLYPFRSFAPTSSIVFRNNLIKQYPDWCFSCVFGDRILFTMLSKHGKIKYFDFIGSVRRIHAGSITLTFTVVSDARNRIIFFKNIPSYLGSEYKPLCNRYLKYFYELLIKIYFENNSNNYSYPVSILKGIQYLFSPNYLLLYKVSRINNDKSPYYVFLFSRVIRFYTFILYKFLRPPIRALLIRIFPQIPGENIIDEIVDIFFNRGKKN